MNHLYSFIIDDMNTLKNIIDEESNQFSLSISSIKKIAQQNHFSERKIEIIALEEGILPVRYQRNINSISLSEQIKLLKSKVAVIGCGGLGGNVIELLARIGIGQLNLVDGDKFVDSNINRQRFCNEKSIGKNKVDMVTDALKNINSSLEVKTYYQFIDSDNLSTILDGVNITIDALDNIHSRFILEKACQSLKIPLVHAAVEGFIGQVSTIFPEDKGLKLIYGSDASNRQFKRKKLISVPAITPALIAAFQVQEAIKIILKKENILRKKLLYINLEECEMEILKLDE